MADIRTLDLNLLKAFDTLMDERSVTRAASRLSLTQPAVSSLLARLRDSFNDPLFVRSQRGVVPTLRAQALAAPIKRVLAELDALLQPEQFDPAAARMTLTLSATDYALRAIVLPFLQALRLRAPGVRVAVRAIDETQLGQQLERGEIDLALTTPPYATPELYARRLFDESYVCALRADHPDAQQAALSLDRFCSLDHALVSVAGDAFHGATDTALALLRRERHVAVSVASFLLLPELLKASDLVAVAPRRLVEGMEGICVLAPPLEVPGFSKLAVWHERSHRSPGHQWLRALLFTSCSDEAMAFE